MKGPWPQRSDERIVKLVRHESFIQGWIAARCSFSGLEPSAVTDAQMLAMLPHAETAYAVWLEYGEAATLR